jgi:hypothetical protein
MRDLSEEFASIVNDVISPLLNGMGFSKRTLTYKRSVGDIVQVFNVQRSQWNSKESSLFYFNIGVMHLGVYTDLHDGRLPPKDFKIYDCIWETRLTELFTDQDNDYTLDDTHSFQQIRDRVDEDIREKAIPLFQRWSSLAAFFEFIAPYTSGMSGLHALKRMAVLYHSGSPHGALDHYRTELTKDPNDHYTSLLNALARRYALDES